MSLRIHTNLPALQAARNVGRNAQRLRTDYLRLSSGLRINSAADDAAGLGVSESLRATIASQKVAVRNAYDGISVVQVAEGALAQLEGLLSRMRELAVESASETLPDTERAYLQVEFDAAISEIERIAEGAEWQGVPLIDGTYAGVGLDVQVGVDGTGADRINLPLPWATPNGLGIDFADVDVSTSSLASGSLWRIDRAIDWVSEYRSDLGAAQERLDAALDNLASAIENLTAAESQIRDADFAEESADMGRNQAFVQAGLSVLVQANSAPEAVLELLR